MPVVADYVYDGDHIALVFDDADGPGGNAPTLAHRMLHGPTVDMILAEEDLSESYNDPGRTLWPLGDHLGSIRDVMDTSPGSTTPVNHVQYDSFGNVIGDPEPSMDSFFGYTGRERDEESDLNYYRARYYDPELGRFISKDPIGFTAGDANQYRYVGNGPTNATDPSGLEKVKNPHPPATEKYFRWRDEHGGGPLRAAGTAELHSTNQWAYKDIQPTLVTIQDVSADALSLGLKNNYEIATGHNPARDCEVSSGQRAVQAGLTYGIPVFGAALSKSRWVTGFFRKADDAADLVGAAARKTARVDDYTTLRGVIRVSDAHSGRSWRPYVTDHESVHRFFTPGAGVPANEMWAITRQRQIWGQYAYNYSSIIRYTEEALAEWYALYRRTDNLPKAIMIAARFPISREYVFVSGLLWEGGIGGAVYSSLLYGAYKTGEYLCNE